MLRRAKTGLSPQSPLGAGDIATPLPYSTPIVKPEQKVPEGDELRERIRALGLRCTAARLTVLREMSRSTSPLSHADIATRLAPLGFDRATVYRNLVELAEVGLLSRVDLGDHVWRFEMRGDAKKHDDDHPHFLCTECGEVSCLSGVEVTIKKKTAAARRSSLGKVTEVLLKGLCSHCA
jgi:Fur family transcriptional regulator, ferric uptake regulator